MIFSHCLAIYIQVALDRSMEENLVQLDFSATLDKVSQRGLLCKLRSIEVEGQFLSIVSEFFIDRRQCVRLAGKVSGLS